MASQRGKDDKILYNRYNRGADIVRDDAHIAPAIHTSIYDQYKETTTTDIVSLREWESLCNLIFEEYKKTELYELDKVQDRLIKRIFETPNSNVEELTALFNHLREVILKVYPDTTLKEIIYAVCESLQIDYKKLWDSVLTPKEKQEVISQLNLKYKKSNLNLSSKVL